VSGTKLFWRGSRILDATIASLTSNKHAPLAKATSVVVGGSSAGGLATFSRSARPATPRRATPGSATLRSSRRSSTTRRSLQA